MATRLTPKTVALPLQTPFAEVSGGGKVGDQPSLRNEDPLMAAHQAPKDFDFDMRQNIETWKAFNRLATAVVIGCIVLLTLMAVFLV